MFYKVKPRKKEIEILYFHENSRTPVENHRNQSDSVKGWRAAGKKLSYAKIAEVKLKNGEEEEQMGLF